MGIICLIMFITPEPRVANKERGSLILMVKAEGAMCESKVVDILYVL